MVSGRTGSYQSLATNDQVLNPNGAGLDLNYQGAQGGFSSRPTASQIAPKPRAESDSDDSDDFEFDISDVEKKF